MRWMFSVKQLWIYNKPTLGILFSLALMVFLLPLRWLCAAVIAALIHELGHYCAVILLGGDVKGVSFGVSGAVMKASGLAKRSELICLLAGPLAGVLPAVIFRLCPTVAVCGILQSAYNLLPIYPLDGGKIMRNLIHMVGGTDRIFSVVEYSVLSLLFLVCLYIRIRFGISLFIFLLGFLFRKTPCKPHQDWI